MCGIIGYTGNKSAAPILLDGLERLEYRGYDSAGIAVFESSGVEIIKSKGRLAVLKQKVEEEGEPKGVAGIGHTRWATHGAPSDKNAHPHQGCKGIFTIVHNGIIENYAGLRSELEKEGVVFRSETDTEVIAQLLDKLYDGNPLETIIRTVKKLHGSYALGVLCRDFPNTLFCARKTSPLLAAVSDEGCMIASDITAILPYTRDIYRLDDGEMGVLTADSVKFFNMDCQEIKKEITTVNLNARAAEKGDYEHFMLKEIYEQPDAIRSTISEHIKSEGRVTLGEAAKNLKTLDDIDRIYIVGCGSAYHAGIVGKYVMEELLRIPVEADIASELRYRNPLINEKSLVIFISQSGETADTIAALREAKKRGAKILSVVNVEGSTIARESENVIFTRAGVEIAVATTKAYSSQVAVLYVIAAYMALELGKTDENEIQKLLHELASLPEYVEKCLGDAEIIKELARKYYDRDHAYYIGRNLDYASALEASLKLKEISYVHSEAYAAGELKHGTISLIEEGTLVVALCCCERLLAKTVSNVEEVRARGANVLCVAPEGRENSVIYDDLITVPVSHPLIMPSIEVIPMQLFSYFAAKFRKCDIDKPRCLAKSVTVE